MSYVPDVAIVPSSPAGLSGNFGAVPVPEVLATALSNADAVIFEEEAVAFALPFPLEVVVSHGLSRGGREAMAVVRWPSHRFAVFEREWETVE